MEWTGCTPRSPSETPGLTCVRRSLLAAVLPSPRDAHRAELQRLGGASATGHVVSDRALWLDEWCPTCRVAPGSRCRTSYLSRARSQTKLHVARGWRARPCPKCKALSGEPCRTPSGREASHAHGSAAARSARADHWRTGLAGARAERRCDRRRLIQRPRRSRWPHRQDRLQPHRRGPARRHRAANRSRRALLRARGAGPGSLRLIRRPTADLRDGDVDGHESARFDRRSPRG